MPDAGDTPPTSGDPLRELTEDMSNLNVRKRSSSPSRHFPSLSSLSAQSYLQYVEENCHTWAALVDSGSVVLASVADNTLCLLRKQLASALGDKSDGVDIRQGLIRKVLSGEFPSMKFRRNLRRKPKSSYRDVDDEDSASNMSHELKRELTRLRQACIKCMAPCCSKFGLLGAILSVLMASPDLQEVDVGPEAEEARIDEKPLFTCQDFPCVDFVSPLAHYADVVQRKGGVAPLRRLLLRPAHMRNSRRYLGSKTLTRENRGYLTIPRRLSPLDTVVATDHMTLTLNSLFGSSANFPHLTELVLHGVETDAAECRDSCCRARPEWASLLMANVGRSCPNLKSLEFDPQAKVSNGVLLHLLFRSPHSSLRPFMYHTDVHGKLKAPGEDSYCPFDIDPWQETGLHLSKADEISVIADRFYQSVVSSLKDEPTRARVLQGCIKATDLLKALQQKGVRKVVRGTPKPPAEPEGVYRVKVRVTGDATAEVWMPKKPSYAWVEPLLHNLSQTLEKLILPMHSNSASVLTSPKESVPFLLAALPKLRSLGGQTFGEALRMMRDAQVPIPKTGLTEVALQTSLPEGEDINHEMGRILVNCKDGHILKAVAEAGKKARREVPINLENATAEYVEEQLEFAIANCAEITHLAVSDFDVFEEGIVVGPINAKNVMRAERNLRPKSLTVRCVEVVKFGPLIKALGKTLTGKLNVTVSNRFKPRKKVEDEGDGSLPHYDDEDGGSERNHVGMAVNAILHDAPQVEELALTTDRNNVHDIMRRSKTDGRRATDRLRKVTLEPNATKDVLRFLAAECPNLETAKIRPGFRLCKDNKDCYSEPDPKKRLKFSLAKTLQECGQNLTHLELGRFAVDTESFIRMLKVSRLEYLSEPVVVVPSTSVDAEEDLAELIRVRLKVDEARRRRGLRCVWRWSDDAAVRRAAAAFLNYTGGRSPKVVGEDVDLMLFLQAPAPECTRSLVF